MIKGETELRKALTEAIANGEHLDEVDSIVDAVIPVVASLELFVHMGKIYHLMEADWLDYGDGWRSYTAYVDTDEVL